MKDRIKASQINRGLEIKKITCPVCSGRKWELIGNIEGAGDFLDMDNRICSGTLTPVVKVMCRECGFVAHFNAKELQKCSDEA